MTALQIQRALISSEKLLSNVTFPDITEPSVKTFSIFQTIILFLNRGFFSLSSSNNFQLSYFSPIFPHLSSSFKLLHYISYYYKHTFLPSSLVQPCGVIWPFVIPFLQCFAQRKALPFTQSYNKYLKLEGVHLPVVQSLGRAQSRRRVQLGGCYTAPQPFSMMAMHHP